MEDLNPKQLRALVLLAAGASHKEAAEECGVSVRAIETWKTKPQFRRMLTDAVGKVFDQAIAPFRLPLPPLQLIIVVNQTGGHLTH